MCSEVLSLYDEFRTSTALRIEEMATKRDEGRMEPSNVGPAFHVLVGDHRYLVVHTTQLWQPPTDVIEDGDRLLVLVEVAGMQNGEFDVTLSDRQLTITGVRSAPLRPRAAYHQLEVQQGEFRVNVILPWAADGERIEATYEDGFLMVMWPRSSSDRVHVVPVNKSSLG
jgi:HSP20 family protein